MLAHTFAFLSGIGPGREQKLWRHGIRTWDDYRAAPRVKGIGPDAKRQHDAVLAIAERALARDTVRSFSGTAEPTVLPNGAAFFARVLPASEHWRAYDAFAADAVYLDIETAQDGGVTVLGVHTRGASRFLVRGESLTREAATDALAGASCLVTFNGASFDLPVLRAAGVDVPTVPHVDLRYPLRRLGYRGGLKAIERALGLARGNGIDGLSGYDALILWARHERGEEGALATLLDYNRADIENLVPLARWTFDRLKDATIGPYLAAPRQVALPA